MFSRQILAAFAAVFIGNALAFSDETPPITSRSESLETVGRKLVTDISRFAAAGDAELAGLLATHYLNGNGDWEVLAKDEPEMELHIRSLCADLLRLAPRNAHAAEIVEKFKIKQQTSTAPPRESSNHNSATDAKSEALARIGQELTEDISRFAVQGDTDLMGILETYHLKTSVNWTALAADQQKLEYKLQSICTDLLQLARRNAHAAEIVEKFKIKQAPTAPPPK
jgi:hypothetical protein